MKKILCFVLALATAAVLLCSCGFDFEKEDLSKYIKLGEYSTFDYNDFEGIYENYRKYLSDYYAARGESFVLTDGFGLDFKLAAELITYGENDDGERVIDSAERYDPWCFDTDDDYIKNYDIGKNEDYAMFDTFLIYDVEGATDGSAESREITLGEDFSFIFNVPTKDGGDMAGKTVRFTVTPISVLPGLSDSAISDELSAMLDSIGCEKETAELDDSVIISYAAKADGKKFDGGDAENANIKIGGGNLPPEVEDAIIGHKAGDTFSVELTLPQNFANADVAGKDAVYEITVGQVYNVEKAVAEKTEFGTFWDLKCAVKVRTYAKNALLSIIADDSEVISYPAKLLTQYEKYYKNEVDSRISAYLTVGYTEAQAYEMLFGDEEKARAYIVQSAETSVADALVAYSIKKIYGIEYTDDDYIEDLKYTRDSLYYYYGEMLSTKEIEKMYTKEILSAQFVYEKCTSVLYDLVTVKNEPNFPKITAEEQ